VINYHSKPELSENRRRYQKQLRRLPQANVGKEDEVKAFTQMFQESRLTSWQQSPKGSPLVDMTPINGTLSGSEPYRQFAALCEAALGVSAEVTPDF